MTRSRRLRLGTAVAALVGSGLLVVAPAYAEGWFVDSDSWSAPALAPGHSASHRLTVRNPTDAAARLDLRLLDVVEAENGCLDNETEVVAEECDADGGELGRDLLVSVGRPDGELLWSGRFPELADGVTLTDDLAPGVAADLDVTFLLDPASPNDTMTDTVGFAAELTAAADGDVVEVAGAQATLAGQGGSAAGGTGGPVPTSVDAGLATQVPVLGGQVPLGWLLADVLAVLGALVVGTLSLRRRRVLAPVRRGAHRVGR